MKKKLFPLLLICMLITGCAQTPSGNTASSDTKSTVSETVETVVSDTADSETSADNAKSQDRDDTNASRDNADAASPDSSEAAPTEEDSDILTFEATTIDGQTITSDCFADSKLTMINIWATYCGPCLVELPELGQLVEEYDKSDFQILGIISDVHDYDLSVDHDEVMALIKDCAADNFPHMIVNRDLTLGLVTYVTAVPTTYFVNQEGKVLGYVVGANYKADWMELIDELLAEIE